MKTVSLLNILAKINRYSRYTIPKSSFNDIKEFITEGMRMLETTYTYEPTSKIIEVKDHKCPLPCGWIGTIAVEYKGSRLRLGSDVLDYHRQTANVYSKELSMPGTVIFISDNPYPVPLPGFRILELPEYPSEYYREQNDYLHFSFREGWITLHYHTLPVDAEGYPLVPDKEEYFQGLLWWVFASLTMGGWEHPAGLSYGDCNNRFEEVAGRAINSIKTFTPENAERILQSQVRLIFPSNFYEDFGRGMEQVQEVNTHVIDRNYTNTLGVI